MDSDIQLIVKLKQYRSSIFRSHAEYILKSYLQDWVARIIDFKPSSPVDYTAIVIEDRVDDLIKFSIYNTLIMSKCKMRIVLFTTDKSYKLMQEIFKDLSNWVVIFKLNDELNRLQEINRTKYNKILKNQTFWKMLPTRNILIFQTDALLIEPIDYSMFKYDYVGAPFAVNKHLSTAFPDLSNNFQNKKKDRWITQVFNHKEPIPDNVVLGNGGLSIRNRDVMLEICKKEPSYENENEDIYFSRLINKYSKNIVPFEIAQRFSCECSYSKSIGSHASYLYLTKEQQAEIYERHIKHIFALLDLSITQMI
mgnify:CR=1 FL=1